MSTKNQSKHMQKYALIPHARYEELTNTAPTLGIKSKHIQSVSSITPPKSVPMEEGNKSMDTLKNPTISSSIINPPGIQVKDLPWKELWESI